MTTGIILIIMAILSMIIIIKNNKSKKIALNENLELDLHYFEKTKNMSWIETCSVLRTEIQDFTKRENIKMKIKTLRRLKNID